MVGCHACLSNYFYYRRPIQRGGLLYYAERNLLTTAKFHLAMASTISNQQSRKTVAGTSASVTVSSVTSLNRTF